MRNLQPILFILLFHCLSFDSNCQVSDVGAKAVFSADKIVSLSDGISLIGGAYGNNAELDGNPLPHKGKIDLFLGLRGANGFIQDPWILQSREEDTWTSLSVSNNSFITTGTFWDSLWLNQSLVALSPEGKAGFVLIGSDDFSGLAELFLVEGTGFKNVNASFLNDSNDFYISGSFSDSLFLLDTFLVSSEGRNAFVAHIIDEEVVGINQFGDAANVDVESMTMCHGKIYVGGSFLGVFAFGEDTLETQTSDVDGFLVSLDVNFHPVKGFQFGGVFPDNVKDCKCDGEDLWIGGDFLGVLKIDENRRLESNGFETDLFTILVSGGGQIIDAERWGGTGGEILETLIISGEKLFMGGYFTGEMNVGAETISTPAGKINGYILKANKTFGQTRLRQVKSSVRSSVEMLSPARDTGFVGCGFYGEDLVWENEQITSELPFQAYILELNHITSAQNLNFSADEIEIYPNPAKDVIWLNSTRKDLRIFLFNTRGNLVLQHQDNGPIQISHLRSGIYFYSLYAEGRLVQSGKVVKY